MEALSSKYTFIMAFNYYNRLYNNIKLILINYTSITYNIIATINCGIF